MSGESASVALHPPVLWAQRTNCVFITVNLCDVKDELVNVKPEGFTFKGKVDGDSAKNYELCFDFFAEVNPDKVKRDAESRVVSLCIEKKEPGVWPRLLKDAAKQFWLKTDFNKWKDLEGSDSEGEGGFGGSSNFEDMLSAMGNNKDFDGLDDDEGNDADADSDDEDLPDLEEPEKAAKEEEGEKA